MSRIGVLSVLLVALMTGCSERVYISTMPPGAKIFVNNTEAGVAPFVLRVPSKSLPSTSYTYRMELAGYRSVEGTLPVHVSAGRVIGAIGTFGILYVARGVRVFEEYDIQQSLYPLEAASAYVDGVAPGMPHSRKVFFTTAPLSSLPPDSYVFIKDLGTWSQFYGSSNRVLDWMAVDARQVGADAVFEVETRFRPGAWAWARPEASGKAIALTDPCATAGISGVNRPTDEADTPSNRALSARCDQGQNLRQQPSPGGATSASGNCSLDQVLAMKAAGLSDDQVKAACSK